MCLELGVMVSRKVTPGRGLGADATWRAEPARGREWAAGSFGLLGNQRRTRRGEGKGGLEA